MVFFDDDRIFSSNSDVDPSVDDEHGNSQEKMSESSFSDVSPTNSCSITTQTHLVVEVRSHSHGHPSRVDLSVSSISALSRDAEIGTRTSSPSEIPVARSVASIRTLFDIAEPSSSTYNHGREIGGRSSVLALQVPASSLPPPFSASAMVDSFHINTSPAFFPTLSAENHNMIDAGPSKRESMTCIPCQTLDHGQSSRDRDSDLRIQSPNPCEGGQGEIVRRLTEVLQGRSDEVALLSAGKDNIMLQWLRALDVHVVGACRADERLRPMLRWNMPCSEADGCLLAHLSQHFKAKELGLLARCLCAPLVSVRVGKVKRHGRFLCPQNTRGYLSLTMLPSSEMRLSYVGDDGVVERIASVRSVPEVVSIDIEILTPDSSGRTFALKLPGSQQFFWQSEKSKIVGEQLITEMKDLLLQRPSLSQLTGVQHSRLGSFMNQLRGVLRTPAMDQELDTSSTVITSANVDTSTNIATNLRQSRRLSGSKSLSPNSCGFKDVASRALINSRSGISSREKYKRCLDTPASLSCSPISSSLTSSVHANPGSIDGVSQSMTSNCVTVCIRSSASAVGVSTSSLAPDENGLSYSNSSVTVNPKHMVSVPMVPPTFSPSTTPGSIYPPVPPNLPLPPTSTFFAPYFCPCPVRSSAFQYAITPPFLPPVTSEISTVTSSSSIFSLKPSSSVLSQTSISLDRVNISPIPLPVTSLVNIPAPLQIPSFFSDPIVHIPVIDFQPTTQGFLVNTSPAISSCGVPPVLPSFVSSILSSPEQLGDGQDLPALSIFKGLEIGACKSDSGPSEIQPIIFDSRLRAVLANCSSERSSKDSHVEQRNDVNWFQGSESFISPVLDTLPQYSGPLIGMVPAILTTGSVSCVLNYCDDRTSQSTPLVSGSRGLYGGSCEPGIPIPSISSAGRPVNNSTDIFDLSHLPRAILGKTASNSTFPDVIDKTSEDQTKDQLLGEKTEG